MTQTETINLLREAFGKIERIDPAGPAYARLCDILDRADDAALTAVYRARIPFASLLAGNRMYRRGIPR